MTKWVQDNLGADFGTLVSRGQTHVRNTRLDAGHSWRHLVSTLNFTLMSDSPSTPAADFSSSPPKRTKIVLLGDQSVGKTSLITRCVSLYFE